MSGGFFRGTSAEQDTRFSNKQAKLLKSQKFAPELDHLVDITKVKMDVVKPWIAKRATELLGFEDEVLINFINGLLEGKDINGKQIQIQLTGFMEKHTGKFMKELWSLLLSAQNNASGVPQQFLDAKEEETRKKKEELDRIGNEMQKIKEKGSRLFEQVHSKTDGGVIDYSTAHPNSKYAPAKDSNIYFDDEREPGKRNGFRGRSRASRSPKSPDRRSSLHRERNRPKNLSKSPPSRQHSISSERRYRSPQRSVSPLCRRSSDESLSPRRRSPKRLSTSHSRNRSLSPARRTVRSPMHRRLPSPGRRRSRSRLQRRSRSPIRHRSPSPWRRRSLSPWRCRSRSPRHRRSPSPWRRRSPSPRRRQSPSSVRRHRRRSLSSSTSPVTRRPLSPFRNRSPSKCRSPLLRRSSPLPRRSSPLPRHMSPSPLKKRSPSLSRAMSLSPVSGSPSVKRRVPVSSHLRSHNQPDRSFSPRSQVSSSPVRPSSSSPSDGDPSTLKKDPLHSPRDKPRNRDQCSPRFQPIQKGVNVSPDVAHKGRDTARLMASKSPHSKDHTPSEDRVDKAYKCKSSQRSVRSPRHGNMYTPEKSSGEHYHEDNSSRKEKKDIRRKNKLTKDAIGLRNATDDVSSSAKPAVLKEGEESLKLMKKDDLKSPALDFSGCEGSDGHKAIGSKKRRHRKSSRHEIGCESSGDDSGVEDRKEAKRRRKEDKKLRKEERRRHREERQRCKEEKRVYRRKRSKGSDYAPSDSDKHEIGVNTYAAKDSYSSDKQETELEKKRLEIELREKALQNIRAKKGMGR